LPFLATQRLVLQRELFDKARSYPNRTQRCR